MEDFLGELLNRIDQTGDSFSETAYGALSTEIMPLLRVMFLAYVAFYGLQLFMGTARVGVAEIIGRVARMMLILTFVETWSYFNTFFYQWLTQTPEAAGRAILAAAQTTVTEPTNGLSQIWKAANEAAGKIAEQAGWRTVLPALIGFIVMACAAIFIAIALAILILAKVIMWVLIGTAPIFIACMLFQQTRHFGSAWFQQVVLYALIPLFVYVIAAFLITAINPELEKVQQAANNNQIDVSHIAAFVLLCLAGAFVIFNIQTLAQGIAGGLAMGVGGAARAAMRWSTGTSLLTLGKAAQATGYVARQSARGGGFDLSRNRGGNTATAMQNRIANNSVPR